MAFLHGTPPAYQPLRYDEDFSFLRDSRQQTDPFDAVKFIPLGSGPDEWLSFGGESRTRYEYFDHALLGAGTAGQ